MTAACVIGLTSLSSGPQVPMKVPYVDGNLNIIPILHISSTLIKTIARSREWRNKKKKQTTAICHISSDAVYCTNVSVLASYHNHS